MNLKNITDKNEKLLHETTPLLELGDDHISAVLTDTSCDELKIKIRTEGNSTIRSFAIMSFTYLIYSISDGSIRTMVLFHAYESNCSAFLLAIIFTFYEFSSMISNLLAGVLVSHYGIKYVVLIGLTFQIISYSILFLWNTKWNQLEAILYVTLTQLLSGSAKDLIKVCGKSITKLVKLNPNENDEQEKSNKLYRIVSILTGWKNSFKGLGYFFATFLLQYTSYNKTSWLNIVLLLILYPFVFFGLGSQIGRSNNNAEEVQSSSLTNKTVKLPKIAEIFPLQNINLIILSLSRLFLFASRDFWFEIPLPFYLRSPSCNSIGMDHICNIDHPSCTSGSYCDNILQICTNRSVGGGCGGLGLSRSLTGTILGAYIIIYGQIQSCTPQLITRPLLQNPPNKLTEAFWGIINCIPTFSLSLVLRYSPSFQEYQKVSMAAWLILFIISFAFIFAVNSSIHSYLVVKYAKTEKVAISVGFYYMSNAFGRLVGTFGSGVLYTFLGEDLGDYIGVNGISGLSACLMFGTLSSMLAAMITMKIQDQDSGLKCGSCWTLVEGSDKEQTSIEKKNVRSELGKNKKKINISILS